VSHPYAAKDNEISSRGHKSIATGLNVNTSDRSLGRNMVKVPVQTLLPPDPLNILTNESLPEESASPAGVRKILRLNNHKSISF